LDVRLCIGYAQVNGHEIESLVRFLAGDRARGGAALRPGVGSAA